MFPDSARRLDGWRTGWRGCRRPLAGLAVALVIAGCGSGLASAGHSQPPSGGTAMPIAVTVSSDHVNGRTVRVHVGERLNLILSSTYWQLHGSSAPAVLRQNGAITLLPRPSSCPKLPGLGCVPVRASFEAMAPGTAVITASRTTCGEALACAADLRHFRVTIVVR